MDESIVNKVYGMLKIYFTGSKPTHTEIEEQVDKLLNLFLNGKPYSKNVLDLIVEKYEVNAGIKAYEPDVLINLNSTTDWFEKAKCRADQKHDFFNRYKEYLRNDDFPEDVIDNIEKNCEKILSYCADPTNPFDIKARKKRGLVVGDVQSGKTANYLALMNMACDYKYKIILVLAGLTDSLRQQTQKRIDSGFVGAISDTISDKIEYCGVGVENDRHYAIPLTNTKVDFNKFVQESNNAVLEDYSKPLVLVVKKNKKTLENVKSWLKPGKNNIKFDNILIIDDEADNASLNTNDPDRDPSVINGLIRDIFNNFTIASYVGYTATPYANIFVNPYSENDNLDLFPEDFIILLNSPDNYFGEKKVFGFIDGKRSRHIREINEAELNFLPVKHKKDDEYFGLSESLKEAILSFLLNNVIRTIRGHKKKHRTMMINISRFNNMQKNIRDKVEAYVEKIKNIIEQSGYMPLDMFIRDSEMKKLYDLYNNNDFYKEIKEEVEWNKIQSLLDDEVQKFKTVIINTQSKGSDRFNYEDYKDEGARVIAIGGFVLSRGLTLEGLMISYYSRNGSAYDTLLQMCRWFGYRPKYEDLCRIYISNINLDCFDAVIDATNDLKEQFREMRARSKKPADFGLMVKTSPDVLNTTLLITSRNKMRHSEEVYRTLNYSATAIDTSKIYKEKSKNLENLKVFNDFVENIKADGVLLEEFNKRFLFRNVNKKHIVNLLKKIRIPAENKKFDLEGIVDCISNSEKLDIWDVAIATGLKGEDKRYWTISKHNLPIPQRSFEVRNDENYVRISGGNNRLAEPGIFNSGLSLEQIEHVKEKTKGKTPIARDYLSEEGRKPLLIIYPIELVCEEKDANYESKANLIKEYKNDIIMGFAIGFPANGNEVIVKYRLNKIKLEEITRGEEDIEDDAD